MKKLVSVLLSAALAVGLLGGCANTSSDTGTAGTPAPAGSTQPSDQGGSALEGTVIKVGASPAPHAEILEVVKELLAEQGITLEITEFDDYILPNQAVEDGSLDANYFQHITYLNNFNVEYGTSLASAAEVHYEPFGIYAGKTASLAELADGAQIAVPNDTTNEGRALLLLQDQGLITLSEDAGPWRPPRTTLWTTPTTMRSWSWRPSCSPPPCRTWMWPSSTATTPSTPA